MPPNEPEITFVEGAPYVYLEINFQRDFFIRSFDREHYRPRYRRKIGILKYWLVVHKRRYFEIKEWIFYGRWP